VGVLAGIFVGGAGERMGGAAKGLLRVRGEPIVERLARTLRESGLEVVLVGERAEYTGTAIRTLADAPGGIGPLGGLRSLLAEAQSGYAIAVACDMPYVSPELVARLASAEPAAAVAPRRDGRWEPLFARYLARDALPVVDARIARGARSLQALLDELGAVELPLGDRAGELDDWDRPSDVDDR
jgi:molybdopterin-guanine dinucleotide biosynthesis protein A